ncbi:MAG: hypothetical protein ACKVOK_14795, partial [Flavobacteriales bacterium]
KTRNIFVLVILKKPFETNFPETTFEINCCYMTKFSTLVLDQSIITASMAVRNPHMFLAESIKPWMISRLKRFFESQSLI